MRRILFIALLFVCSAAHAQTFPNTDSLRGFNNRYIRNSAIEAFTNLRLNTLLKGIINEIDSTVANASGFDSTYIYAAVNARVRYSDSSAMLSAYHTLIDGKLSISDTAAMLSAYRTLINAKLNASDTGAMLSAYLSLINARVKYSDTTNILSAYQTALNTRVTITYVDNANLLNVKYTDTSNALSAYQTALNARIKWTDSATLLSDYRSALLARAKYSDTGTILSAYATALNARVPTSRTITIYGADTATKDLSANRTYYPRSLAVQAFEALGSTVKAQTVGVELSQMTTTTALVDGQTLYGAIWVPYPMTVTGFKFYLGTTGNFTGDNTNGLALFSYSAGVLTKVASSANDANIWKGSAGSVQTVAFAGGSIAISAGIYYVCFLYNNSAQTTAPTIGVGQPLGASGMAAGDFTNSAKIVCNQASQTDFPATTINMTSLSNFTTRNYAALY